MNKGEGEFDDVISDFAQYGRLQFWEERYLNDHEPFEWWGCEIPIKFKAVKFYKYSNLY